MLLLTLPGTPTTYYGEELGMENINVTESEIQDPAGKYNAVSTMHTLKNTVLSAEGAKKKITSLSDDITKHNVYINEKPSTAL